jgi:hypothetical protein
VYPSPPHILADHGHLDAFLRWVLNKFSEASVHERDIIKFYLEVPNRHAKDLPLTNSPNFIIYALISD